MSVQVIVATPFCYYHHYLRLGDPNVGVDEFFQSLRGHPDLTLARDDSDTQFFCNDLSPNDSWYLDSLLVKHAPELEIRTSGDAYLPGRFEGRRTVHLDNYIQPGNYFIVSTSSLLERVQYAELNLAEWVNQVHEDNLRGVLRVYRDAIEISNRTAQPIFLSY